VSRMSPSALVPSLQKLANSGPAVLRARWYLRSADRLGSKVRIWGHPSIRNQGQLLVGNRVRIVSTMATVELAVGKGGCLEIGENVFINYGCSIAATLSVRIGPNCNIGSHVIMMDNDFHSIAPERRHQVPPSAPIVLEEGVWLGVRVIVLRGVTIGTGSVIGAGSVVARDIPARCIAAGVPAKVIRNI
jgi:acetyltransferase-like isoleucine patch superfamily enzyme